MRSFILGIIHHGVVTLPISTGIHLKIRLALNTVNEVIPYLEPYNERYTTDVRRQSLNSVKATIRIKQVQVKL